RPHLIVGTQREPDRSIVAPVKGAVGRHQRENGRLARTFALSTSATRATLPRLRLRLRLLFCRMWRLPCLRRSTLPVAVTLKRLATAFLVLARPEFLDIGAWKMAANGRAASGFWEDFSPRGTGWREWKVKS